MPIGNNNSKWTELVSRVLYARMRGNHLSSLCVTAQFKPNGSATMKITDGQPAIKEFQGVASDRVYSKPMLP